jgi:hypothetical protein
VEEGHRQLFLLSLGHVTKDPDMFGQEIEKKKEIDRVFQLSFQ